MKNNKKTGDITGNITGNMNDLKFFIKLFAPHIFWLRIGAILAILTLAFSIALLTLSGWFISASAIAGIIATSGGVATAAAGAFSFNFLQPSAGIRFFAIGRTVTRYFERVTTHDATFRALKEIRVWLFKKAIPLAPAKLSWMRSGFLFNRLTSDIELLDGIYLRLILPAFSALIIGIMIVIFLAIFAPLIAISTALLLLIAGIAIPFFTAKWGDNKGRQMLSQTADLRNKIFDTAHGLPEILAFNIFGDFKEKILISMQNLYDNQLKMAAISATGTAIAVFVNQLALITALILGGMMLQQNILTAPIYAMLALAVLASFEIIMPLAANWPYLGRTQQAAKRLRQMAETPPPVKDIPKDKAKPLPKNNDLEIKNLHFSYDNNDNDNDNNTDKNNEIFNGFSLFLPEGKKIALIGKSGSGKSTFFDILLRFIEPDKGEIKIGGTKIQEIRTALIRRKFGYMSQHTDLFDTTIKENLLLAKPNATEDELWQALKVAQLDNFVKNLPKTLETPVGQNGTLLSGGEARRIALARIILKDAPILLLDEPTEELDTKTEIAVLNGLKKAIKGKSVIYVSHRPRGLKNFNEIIKLTP